MIKLYKNIESITVSHLNHLKIAIQIFTLKNEWSYLLNSCLQCKCCSQCKILFREWKQEKLVAFSLHSGNSIVVSLLVEITYTGYAFYSENGLFATDIKKVHLIFLQIWFIILWIIFVKNMSFIHFSCLYVMHDFNSL